MSGWKLILVGLCLAMLAVKGVQLSRQRQRSWHTTAEVLLWAGLALQVLTRSPAATLVVGLALVGILVLPRPGAAPLPRSGGRRRIVRRRRATPVPGLPDQDDGDHDHRKLAPGSADASVSEPEGAADDVRDNDVRDNDVRHNDVRDNDVRHNDDRDTPA